MHDPGASVLAALRGPHHRASARLTSLDATRAVRHVWQDATALLLDGSRVSGDRTRSVRRTVSLSIADPAGDWTPRAPGDPFFGGEWLRVERGVGVGGGMAWIPLFTGTVTSFDDTMDGTLQVSGEDALGICQQPFGDAVSVLAGTRAQDVVKALLGPVLGVTQGWTLDDAERIVPDRSWAADDDRLQATWQLMADLGLELFADRMGAVVLRPMPDPTVATPVRTLTSPASDGAILSGTRSGSRLPYNRVVVISELPDDGTIIRAQADVTDPASPIHAGRIGLRIAPVYRSSQIPDQSAANAVARNKLVEYALYQDGYAGDIVPDETLDPGDVIAVRQGITGTDGNYLLDAVSHPITTGTSGLGATKVVPVR